MIPAFILAFLCRRGRRTARISDVSLRSSIPRDGLLCTDLHVALNVVLFPPLIFFCALYYTDVLSTALVLSSYVLYLNRSRRHRSIWLVVLGLASLLARQTNIFWVAVLPALLEISNALSGSGQNDNEKRDLIDMPLEQATSRGHSQQTIARAYVNCFQMQSFGPSASCSDAWSTCDTCSGESKSS